MWWAIFHLGSIIGPFRILTMQSHARKPTFSRGFNEVDVRPIVAVMMERNR